MNEALAAVRAGGTLVVTKLDRFARPYPMLMKIIEVMTRLSQEFRLPPEMTMRI
ncbi:recombinase family protein [Arthrobacter sp. NPDC058130]|uniref:recombinase family protein n=1 Tax=Arthrobacter sp. NPDC058130 TaxID=3346353 RepID=UPI0036E32BD5